MPAQFVNKPLDVQKYTCKQSKYDWVPKLPCRQIAYGQTNSGKSTLVLNQLLTVYRDCFDQIIVISNSWDSDPSWDPLKQYMEEKGWNLKECGTSEYSDEFLARQIDLQTKIVRAQKAKGRTQNMASCCVVFDDVLDTRAAIRGKLIEQIYARQRHNFVSCITSVQSVKRLSNVVRQQSEHIFVWRLRSGGDLDSFLDENSAIVDMRTLEQVYWMAVSKPYGHLWLDKSKQDPDEMFHPDGLGTPPIKVSEL